MSIRNTQPSAESIAPRVVGHLVGRSGGPRLLLIVGIHGNEPAGVLAAQRVFKTLASRQTELYGEVLSLVGNRQALYAKQRFIDVDLNRHWTPALTGKPRLQEFSERESVHEDRELRELQDAVDPFLAAAPGDTFAVDLHTTSNTGAPFATVADTLRNRDFAASLQSAVILGLEEELQGTLLEYLSEKGCVTMGFEAGQHDEPVSIRTHEAVIWVALVAAGILLAADTPEYDQSVAFLRARSLGCPRFFEIQYRHAIAEQDAFQMDPGFTNFDAVAKGQPLAQDARGVVRSPMSGLILMPLYQGLGADGFFVGKAVRPFWLRLSSWVRHLRLEKIMHWLPGVWRVPEDRNVLRVDTRVARLYPLEVFHLLGFRRRRARGRFLYVTRRSHDL